MSDHWVSLLIVFVCAYVIPALIIFPLIRHEFSPTERRGDDE